MLTWNALGTPIFEAFIDLGIPVEAFVQLEDTINIPNSPRAITSTNNFIHGLQHSGQGNIRFDWFFAICDVTPGPHSGTTGLTLAIKTWCQQCLNILHIITQHTMLGSATLIAPLQYPNFYHILSKLWYTNPIENWHLTHRIAHGPQHDAPVSTSHNVVHLGVSERDPKWNPQGKPTSIKDHLPPPSSPTAFYHIEHHDIRNASAHDQQVLNVAPAHIAYFLRQNLRVPFKEMPIFSPDHPAPSILTPRPEEDVFEGLFATHHSSNNKSETCRIVRTIDYARLIGIDNIHAAMLADIPPTTMEGRIRAAAPKHLLTIVLRALHTLEAEDARTHANTMPLVAMVRACPANQHDTHSLISLPTHQAWVAAIQQDPDLKRILQTLKRQAPHPRRTDLKEPCLLDALQQNQLEVDNDILYYYDHSRARAMRQLRRRIVPYQLRHLVFIACHTSPFAGHSGLGRTLYRLQTRFWWPGMVRDATQGVKGCLHCNLANATSHENQVLLNSQTSQTPFATIYLDKWNPGNLTDKQGNVKVLTAMDCFTGFVMVAL